MVGLYGAALFTSALLLFWVEPMIGKMLLPTFGGAPAVWITCMLFFQAVLLAGYVYAHGSTRILKPRQQVLVHGVLLFLPFLVLPLHFGAGGEGALAEGRNPTLPLLGLLVVRAGLPFFVLSATAPLLQRWFSRLGHPSGRDPYFLYAASNLGSMLALVSYPFVVEPNLGVLQQTRGWTVGMVLLVLLLGACAVAAYRARAEAVVTPTLVEPEPRPVTNLRRLRWVALAFVPSSHLLGVTSYITTDIASIPLFWVAPLALYLGTFIVVFARRPLLPHAVVQRALPMVATLVALLLVLDINQPVVLVVALHLAAFFVAALACHGELGRDRPPPTHLTEFFLWMSVGGVAGGLWNSLLAPVIFQRLLEYPLAIVAGALLAGAIPCKRPSGDGPPHRSPRLFDVVVPAGILAATLGLLALAPRFGVGGEDRALWLFVAVPAVVNYASRGRPLRFGLGLAALLAGGVLVPSGLGTVLHTERNFFGIVRVTRDPTGRFVQVADGNTVHGRQSIDPARRREPTGYYHRSGPLGEAFAAFHQQRVGKALLPARVGVVGLGAGGLAAYAVPGEGWTFYEINPAMVHIAQGGPHFTFLRDAFPEGRGLRLLLGDARLRLREADDGAFDLLVLDAFSSDAIPPHLLTREALALYQRKLAAGGLLVFNVSNRYLDLRPALGALAKDGGLVAYARPDGDIPEALEAEGKLTSQWAAMARHLSGLGDLPQRGWARLDDVATQAPWTDDRSSLLAALRW